MLKVMRNLVSNVPTRKQAECYRSCIVSLLFERNVNTVNTNTPVDTLNYSMEDNSIILSVINTSTREDLERYKISKKHLLTLSEELEKNGPFTSINQLLNLPDMKEKSLNRFCESILNSQKCFIKNLTVPKLEDDKRMKINTVLGVHVGANVISWSLMNRKCEILQWECASYLKIYSKINLLNFMKLAAKINLSLPEADVYVIENNKVTVPKNINHAGMYYLLLRNQLYSMTMYNLVCRNKKFVGSEKISSSTNDLYMLNTRIMGKLFDLHIGSEMKSPRIKVEELIKESSNTSREKRIILSEDIQAAYNKYSSVEQEQMTYTLLLTLTFLELGVLGRHFDHMSV